jgi:hypothetical protein
MAVALNVGHVFIFQRTADFSAPLSHDRHRAVFLGWGMFERQLFSVLSDAGCQPIEINGGGRQRS